MNPTKKTKVKRAPKRGFYDKETIYAILDKDFVCQIAFVYENYPVIIPTIYGRKGAVLYLHGAAVSRMLLALEKGIPIAVNVTQTDGIVLVRSAFHHSLNYHSVTIFGNATLVTDAEEKLEALKIISDQIIPDRWGEVRPPNTKEMNVTKVVKIPITEASAKIRTGPPVDEKSDYSSSIWAGVLPITKQYGEPLADEHLHNNIPLPDSLKKMINNE